MLSVVPIVFLSDLRTLACASVLEGFEGSVLDLLPLDEFW
jgi:hypothetical protein